MTTCIDITEKSNVQTSGKGGQKRYKSLADFMIQKNGVHRKDVSGAKKKKVQIGSVLNSFFLSFHVFVLGVGDYGWNKGDGMDDGCVYIYSPLQCRDIS